MKAGSLRHRVTLRSVASVGKDASGAAVPVYADAGTFWAEVRTLSAGEQQRMEIDTLVASTLYQVTLREPLPVVPAVTWQVSWRGRLFDIQGIQEPDNRGRMQRLLCAEVVPHG